MLLAGEQQLRQLGFDLDDLTGGEKRPATDQRGFTRPSPTGGYCDSGAFEYQQFLTTVTVSVEGSGSVNNTPGNPYINGQTATLELCPVCVPDITTQGTGVGDPGYGDPDGIVTGAIKFVQHIETMQQRILCNLYEHMLHLA